MSTSDLKSDNQSLSQRGVAVSLAVSPIIIAIISIIPSSGV